MTTIYLYFRSFTADCVHGDQVLRLQADQVARAGKRKRPDKSDLFSCRRRNRFQSGRRQEGTVISRNRPRQTLNKKWVRNTFATFYFGFFFSFSFLGGWLQ